MKTVMTFNPVFNPVAKTLDFSAYSNFDIKRLFAVINTTRNQVIFATGQAALGAASFSSNILTLVFDTSAHNSGDTLTIIYDEANAIQKTQDATLNSLVDEMKGLVEVIQSMALAIQKQQPQIDIFNRPMMRLNAIDSNLTLTALTNLNNFSGGNTSGLPYQLSNSFHIYNNITVTP